MKDVKKKKTLWELRLNYWRDLSILENIQVPPFGTLSGMLLALTSFCRSLSGNAWLPSYSTWTLPKAEWSFFDRIRPLSLIASQWRAKESQLTKLKGLTLLCQKGWNRKTGVIQQLPHSSCSDPPQIQHPGDHSQYSCFMSHHKRVALTW